jgi:hypothetical protein
VYFEITECLEVHTIALGSCWMRLKLAPSLVCVDCLTLSKAFLYFYVYNFIHIDMFCCGNIIFLFSYNGCYNDQCHVD